MSVPLYDTRILRLAAESARWPRLAVSDVSIERRTPVCGSRIVLDVMMAGDRVQATGVTLHACALGQASASLLGAHAIGRSPDELAEARDALAAFLAGTRDDPGTWPGLDIFAPARPHSARHASIRLAFEAAAEAAAQALGRKEPA